MHSCVQRAPSCVRDVFHCLLADFRFRANDQACGQVKNVRDERAFSHIFHLAANQW